MSKETKNKKIIAIIGARGGSKGVPKKNITPLLGKPLIYYTIKAALDSKLISRVIVSTDDEEIAKIARKYGAETPFLRPKELAKDTSNAESFLKHAVEWLEKNDGYSPDIVVYLQITDIFRKKGIIDKTIKALLDDESLDSVFVGKPTHKKYWRLENNRYVRVTNKRYMTRQESAEKELLLFFREDTGIACATRISVIKNGERVGENVKIIVNDDDNTDIDIHDKRDLWLAKQILLKEKKEKGDKSEYYF